jgi:hypothetical protein
MDLCNHKPLWLYGFGKSHHHSHCKICTKFFFSSRNGAMNFDGKGYCVCEEIIVQIQGVTLIPKAYVEGCCQTNFIANCPSSFYKSISILWPLFLVENLEDQLI